MDSDSHFSSSPHGCDFDPTAILDNVVPEQRLWQAVAIQAIRDCVASDSALGKSEHKAGAAHARNEARQWCISNERYWHEARETVCDAGGIDPESVRRAALRLIALAKLYGGTLPLGMGENVSMVIAAAERGEPLGGRLNRTADADTMAPRPVEHFADAVPGMPGKRKARRANFKNEEERREYQRAYRRAYYRARRRVVTQRHPDRAREAARQARARQTNQPSSNDPQNLADALDRLTALAPTLTADQLNLALEKLGELDRHS